jgi:ribokinase
MCACVGDDMFGQDTLLAFKNEGIDTTHVRVVEGVATGTAVIVVTDGENRIILDKGANACLTKKDIDEFLATAEAGDIYLTQLENPIEVIGYGLKKAKEKGMFVVLNPAPANTDIRPYLTYCDLITPNETEIEILGGKEEILNNTNAKLLITLGSKGYSIQTQDGEQSYPCIKVKAVDTTAAGDTLSGGLCAKLAQGETLEVAAAFGSKAASIACTRKGAQPSVPTVEEVENYS